MLTIVHELPGRLRLRGADRHEADLLEKALVLRSAGGILGIDSSPTAISLLVRYDVLQLRRDDLLLALDAVFSGLTSPLPSVPEAPAAEEDGAVSLPMLFVPLVIRPLLPQVFNRFLTIKRAWPRLRRGFLSLVRGMLNIDVLDAASLAVCIVLRDFRTLSTITLLLGLGEFLEHWTKKRSEESLAASLAQQAIKAKVLVGDEEKTVDASVLRAGDMIVVRRGSYIPADGVVMEGEGLVDEALMTGEAKLKEKYRGRAVFAGSLLEEGELLLQATEDGDKTVWRRTLNLLSDAEHRKAGIQGQAEKMASLLAPFTLSLALGVYLFTRDLRRAAAVLLVDYSCAIKLATPLAVLSAMRQAGAFGMTVRGGRHLEDLAKADVVVFDKTGTLTLAQPSIKEILPCNGWNRTDGLRLAACLEEHFPHPVAKAVVHQAAAEALDHAEQHASVEYVTAHGIVSCLEGARIILGSRHFVEDDENVDISPVHQQVSLWDELGHTVLYLAVAGELVTVFALDDPLRPECRTVIDTLKGMGIKRTIMLTGDLDGMAHRTSREIGINEWMAQALPDDKHAFIKKLKAKGHTVVMVGDGMNDTAALAEASVGVCMRKGADMARDIADIVLTTEDLTALPVARALAVETLQRIKYNFTFIVGVNSALLLAGLFGFSPPALGAVLHNSATIAAAINAIRPYKNPIILHDKGIAP